jgi:hypothetical protein
MNDLARTRPALARAFATALTIGALCGTAMAQTFSSPVVGLPDIPGDGLGSRMWAVSGFVTSVAGNEAAVAGVTPDVTFRTLVPTFPPDGSAVGDGLSITAFTGANATDFSGNALLPLNRSFMVLEGFLRIDTPGVVSFALTSDDGSLFDIGGTVVVDNDGNHAPQTVTGSATFTAPGLYPMRLRFFENDGITVFALRAGFNGGAVADLPTALIYTTPVPEAAPWLMFALGLVGIHVLRLRRD